MGAAGAAGSLGAAGSPCPGGSCAMSLVCAKVCASTQRRPFLLSGPAVSLHTPSQGCQVSLLPFTALCQAAPQRCPPCTPINKALADAALLLPSPLPARSLQLHSLSSVHHLAVPSTWLCSSPGRIQHGRGPPAASALLCSALPQRRLREAQPAPPVLFLPLLPALQPSVPNPQALLALSAPQDVPMPYDTSCFPHPLPLVLPSGWEGAAKGAGMGLGGLSRCPGADSLDVQHPTASSDLFGGSVVLYPARGRDSLTWGAWLGHWCLVPGRGAAPDMGSAAPPLPSHHAWPQDASPAANCSSVQGSCSLMDRGGKVQLHPRPSHHRRPPLAGPPPPPGGVRCAQGWP